MANLAVRLLKRQTAFAAGPFIFRNGVTFEMGARSFDCGRYFQAKPERVIDVILKRYSTHSYQERPANPAHAEIKSAQKCSKSRQIEWRQLLLRVLGPPISLPIIGRDIARLPLSSFENRLPN